MNSALTAQLLRDLPPDGIDGRTVRCMAVSRRGEVCLLAVDSDALDYVVTQSGARAPIPTWNQATSVLLRRVWPDQGRVVRSEPMFVVPRRLVQLPDGWLVVGGRCRERGDGTIPNGVFLDQDGRITGTILLGDGVEDVVLGPDGRLWVSYFDEGIYGNFGWGSGGRPPIGAPGLVAFTRDGKRDAVGRQMPDGLILDDVYALTADDTHVWLRPYMSLSVVRLGADPKAWETDTAESANAMAVRGNELVFLSPHRWCNGQFRSELTGRRVRLVGDHQVEISPRHVIVGPEGVVESKELRSSGDRIFVRTTTSLLVVDGWAGGAWPPEGLYGSPQDPLLPALEGYLKNPERLPEPGSSRLPWHTVPLTAGQRRRLTEPRVSAYIEGFVADAEARREELLAKGPIGVFACFDGCNLRVGLRVDGGRWPPGLNGGYVETEDMSDVTRQVLQVDNSPAALWWRWL